MTTEQVVSMIAAFVITYLVVSFIIKGGKW